MTVAGVSDVRIGASYIGQTAASLNMANKKAEKALRR